LYGALDLAHLLPFAASPEAVSSDAGGAALRRRRALGAAMSQFVLEDSIRLSAIETLIPARETESMLRRVVVSAAPGKEDSFAGWSDYAWRDMRSQDRILWETLGWNEEVWERERERRRKRFLPAASTRLPVFSRPHSSADGCSGEAKNPSGRTHAHARHVEVVRVAGMGHKNGVEYCAQHSRARCLPPPRLACPRTSTSSRSFAQISSRIFDPSLGTRCTRAGSRRRSWLAVLRVSARAFADHYKSTTTDGCTSI
jgi:hypothetical protein